MKMLNIKYLTIFLFLVSVSTVYAVDYYEVTDPTTDITTRIYDGSLDIGENTIAELYTYWKLNGEITNTYPYSVFISIPEDMEYSLKSLGTPKDTTTLVGTAQVPYLKYFDSNDADLIIYKTVFKSYEDSESGALMDHVSFEIEPESELNSKRGFWLPPYTTVKIELSASRIDTYAVEESDEDEVSNYDIQVLRTGEGGYSPSSDIYSDNDIIQTGILGEGDTLDMVGPTVYPATKIIDLNELIPASKKQGIKLDNFKLYVRGTISKQNTKVLSIVMPAPIVLKDYSKFDKIISKYSLNSWIDSYTGWVSDHNDLSSYGSQLLDNSLIPDLGYGISLQDRSKIPAIQYTTSSDNDFDFSYRMYWYAEEEDTKDIWML